MEYSGDSCGDLLAFGDDVDLLVIGSRGHGPLQRLALGSTSAFLARRVGRPLLVLPRDRATATSRRSGE
jgi:nucleotide-binding universal stress UspA family protein